MFQRPATAADTATKIGNHTFRATGITAYLKNNGALERAANMAITALPGPRRSMIVGPNKVTLHEVGRVLI